MANTSRYIQINSWALLEYEYLSEPINVTAAKPFKITNSYNNEYSFVNNNIAKNLTNNTVDNNSVQISKNGNKWAYLDTDTIIPTLSSDPNLILDQNIMPGVGILNYDRVKLHIVSGFNLDGLDGLIISIKIKDLNGNKVVISNFTFLPNEHTFKFNSKPIFMGERLYDKYLEFKVPALSSIFTTFQSAPQYQYTLGYIFSEDNLGFDKDALIDLTLHEIYSTEIVNGNRFFVTGEKYETSFQAADVYGLLGATIKESSLGDYYEYFATFDNGFIESYISNLNAVGGQWMIIHQIEVYEQVGGESLRTHNMTVLQDNEFDKPNILRPVILHADIAFSFSMDYTMRFLNKADGQQILRRSSITSLEPKKYGKEIKRIGVLSGYKPIKVYNKILSKNSIDTQSSFIENSPGTFKTPTLVKYVPTFFNNTNISLSTKGKSSKNIDQTIWSQGDAVILINEFDNILRFKIFDKSKDDTMESLDLTTNSNLKLSFILDSKAKVYIKSEINNTIDPSTGEIEFFINSDLSTKLLNQKHKSFYIISSKQNQDPGTVLYQGTYENVSNKHMVIDKINNIKEINIDKKIAILTDLENSKTKAKESVKLERSILKSTESVAKVKRIDELISLPITQIKKELITSGNKKFKLREIPGRGTDFGSNIKIIKPTKNKKLDKNQ